MTSIESVILEVPDRSVGNAFYGAAFDQRRALAKDAGVPPDGTGSHRMAIVSDAGPFIDPDGFAWEAAQTGERRKAVSTAASALPQAN